MKKLMRKAMTVLGSAVLIGATIGAAAAANYPEPFTSSATIVVGADANYTDNAAAVNIQSDLSGKMVVTGGTTTISGGDSVLLQKSSDKLNLGNLASSVFVTSLDEDDMPVLLAAGTYTDDENTDYDYTQKIALGTNLGVEHFSDSDYKDRTPTVGIKMDGSEHVFNYTLDFTTHALFNDSQLETTDIVLMGKSYYVLDVINSSTAGADKLTLLDSANTAIVTEGETEVVNSREISISYISSTKVKLMVDGVVSNSLSAGSTYKLEDGSYVGIKDILYDSKDSGISKVEISIGSGKLEILDGSEVELNDVTVQEVVGFISLDADAKLDKIIIQWTTDDEEFITPEMELTMPGLLAVKFSIGDFVVPKAEETKVDYSGSDVIELKTFIEDGAVTIPLLQTNSTGEFILIGKDSTNRLVTNASTEIHFNQTAGDKYIVASWNSTTEAESYYLKVDYITESNVNKVRFTNVITGTEKKATNSSDVSFGNVVLTAGAISRDGSNKWGNFTINSGGSFNTLYTKEGLKVYLPYFANSTATSEGLMQFNTSANDIAVLNVNYPTLLNYYANITIGTTAGHGFDSFYLYFAEEDKDGNLAKGDVFNVTLDDSSNKIQVSTLDIGSTSATYGYEIGDTDDYEAYAVSDLATKTVFNTGGDQDSVVITYHGDQAYAEMYLAAPSATVGGSAGVLVVTDAEAASLTGNLIVVGGSAINSVAADLLGSAYSEEAFTAKTGVAAGQYLIQSFTKGASTALLVAGYNAEDTTKAVTALLNSDVDTTVGKKYVSASTTVSATDLVAIA